jgi:threonine dehydratase
VRVIGVQPVDADAMARSLRARRRVALPHVGLFADGVAVRQVGVETFRLARALVDEMVLVDTDEICAAIEDVFEDTRSILEPAGALAVAGAKRHVAAAGLRGKDLVAVASGANVDFERLRFVAERAEVGDAREALLAVTLPERPGSLRSLCAAIGERGITELSYRMTDPDTARVFVGVEVRDRKETRTLLRALRRRGLAALDLSDDELAKQHVRHLIGGHAASPEGPGAATAGDALLYRFEFPERPGALARFLERMPSSWNISLFHYRNQGSSYGRVLVGMQVPRRDERAFRRFLADVGYPHVDERGSAAYATFIA